MTLERRRSGTRPRPAAVKRIAALLPILLAAACGPALDERPAGSDPSSAPALAPAAAAPAPPTPAPLPEPEAREWPAADLRTGGRLSAGLGPGETHRYRLPLERGAFLRLRVEQHDVDVELTLEDPAGHPLLTADRLINARGPELVMAVAERAGAYSLAVHAFPGHGAGRYEARIAALRPASGRDRLAAATYQRFRETEGYARDARQRALAAWTDALATWRRLDEPVLEAEVLARLGQDHYDHGEYEPAAARYREAAALLARGSEPYWESLVRFTLASCLVATAEADEAIRQFQAVADLAGTTGDRRLEGAALYGLGTAYMNQGEIQLALGRFQAALAVLPPDDPNTRPLALHNLALLYARHFQDPERARRLFEAALRLYRPAEIPTHPYWQARTLKRLGLLAEDEGRPAEARRDFEAALAVPTGFDACGRATALASLALLEDRTAGRAPADERMADAFAALAGNTCPLEKVTIQRIAGALAERRGEAGEALAAYARERDLATVQGDRAGLADALTAVARAERALGRDREALASNTRALAILEDVRPTVLREDLRAAFFATAQDSFDLQIALLATLGSDEAAWATAERARAQALRDLVLGSGAGLQGRADPALVERERGLQRQLNYLDSTAASLRGEALAARRREIDARVAALETVRGEIRHSSPAYAALTAPEPLSLAAVRRDLLDDGTLLLEYRLGEDASWLWAISRDGFAALRLPPRREIEAAAGETGRWLRSLEWPGQNPPALCELSRQVLAPAAELLGDRRLVVVADGALETIPFAALPDPTGAGPCAGAPPLVAGHEVVDLPSVGALVAERRLRAKRRPAPGWLAVVADPVYGPADERLAGATTAAAALPARRTAALRGAGAAGRFRRLAYSGEEAAAVLAGLPPERVLSATGFAASKATVTGGALAGFRVLHFATHGVLDTEQPLLSRLALSDRDPDGRPIDGALYAHEIYDLDLPAELVVLSACDTALGRPVRGEGLVSGLPRAFLAAGAARVLVSLWQVEDRSTRDLMERFYRGLLGGGLPPGRALQEAQRSLWRAGRPPRQWAAFVLQGDWRPLASTSL